MRELSELELDSLKELTNIGIGQAATALSQMVDEKVDLKVPQVKLVPVRDIPEELGGSEKEVVCLYLSIQGDIEGSTLFLFSKESAFLLAGLLTGTEDEEKDELNEIEESALKEVGNIFTNVFLNCLADMMDIKLGPSLPYFAMDMLGAVIDMIVIAIARVSEYALILDAKIAINEYEIQSNFMILPDKDALDFILDKIKIEQ